ncbi:MAG TPA: S8 family serine peptidase [Firmicutes bacterium]|jgi:subtilisin family serine protease|nr:S8 family serine peptidase [Bacillota bacterium]
MIKGRCACTLLLLLLLCSIPLSPLSAPVINAQTTICDTALNGLKDDSFIPVIAVLENKTDLSRLEGTAEFDNSSSPKKFGKAATELLVKNLQETARSSEKEILPVIEEEIKKGNIKEYNYLWIANAFSARINKKAFQRLADLPQIAYIKADRQYALSSPVSSPVNESYALSHNTTVQQEKNGDYPWNLELINAPSVWQEGIYGDGVVVAIMDTGVDINHPALAKSYRGNLEGHSHETSWYDATVENRATNTGPIDLNGHGTHIAGVILGGTPEEPLGVAPGAHWIGVNIFDKGLAWDSHIAQAFQWLLAPGGDPNKAPDIINCSWASRPEYVTDYLQWQILHNLSRAGIFVVFAAGNNGQLGPGSPASYPHAFSVGAIEKEGNTYKVTDFSSRGPVKWHDITYTKPEITAPGTGIRSCWLNNSYNVLNGTSVAAAHVSGAAALLLQSRPGITPSEISYILKESAYWNPLWNGGKKRPDNVYGFGILDAYSAIRQPLPNKELLFVDGLEEGMANWSTSPDTPWKTTREKVYEGNFALADSPWENYKDNSSSWIALTKPIELCGYHSPVLSFQHFYDLQTGRDKEDDYAYLEISADGKNWGYVYRFSGTNGDFQPFSIPLNLPPDTCNLYIRFRLQSNGNGPGRGWFIDNISVSALPLPLESLESLKLNPEKTVLEINESTKISAEAIFCSNVSRKVDPELIEWSSSNPLVAEVDQGVVKGIFPGETLISAQLGKQRTEVLIEVIGNVDSAMENIITVNGSIKLQGRKEVDKKTRLSFLCKESGYTYEVSSLYSDGNFSLKLLPGSYTITASREQYLPAIQTISLSASESPPHINLELKAGDIDSNNRIDLTDLTLLSLAYQTGTGDNKFNALADLNGDGFVDISDLTMLTQNYGSTRNK